MDTAKKSTAMNNKGGGNGNGEKSLLKEHKEGNRERCYLAFLTFAFYFVFCICQCLCEVLLQKGMWSLL